MERFKILNDLEVLDTQTGLIWRRDYRERVSWDEALEYAASLGNGWRLPTKDELMTLVNKDRENPASDFPNMPSERFWASLSDVDYPSSAWSVYFGSGSASSIFKTGDYDARCVREGAGESSSGVDGGESGRRSTAGLTAPRSKHASRAGGREVNETRKTRAAARVRVRAAWDALIIAATAEAEEKQKWKETLRAAEAAEIEWHAAVQALAAVADRNSVRPVCRVTKGLWR